MRVGAALAAALPVGEGVVCVRVEVAEPVAVGVGAPVGAPLPLGAPLAPGTPLAVGGGVFG